MRIRVIAVFAALSLLLTAGIASANGDGGKPEGDTLFNFGYDPQAQLFLYSIAPATEDSVATCSLANSALAVSYGDADDDDIILVQTDGAECNVSAVPVGTNGRINHGQFMKLFNELIDTPRPGCLNRWLAKSELGKNDQHIRNKDIVASDADFETGGVVFDTAIATCEKKDKPEDHTGQGDAEADKKNNGNGHGRPGSLGNSDKAPGQQKKP